MVGKVISTQIPTTIPMKPITVSSTTMNTIENVPRVPLKGFSIKEGERGSSNALVKTISIVDPKGTEKVILPEQSDEEENDPPGLNKGDPNRN